MITDSKAPLLKAAWDKFNLSMEKARQAIEATPRFDNPANRAQGYYALLEAQAMAYNWIVAPRLNHPRIFTHTAWATYLFTVAGNCPDIIYSILPVDGHHTYHIKGRYGDVRLMLMQVLNKPMGVDGSRCTGNFEFAKSNTKKDEIDIILSSQKPEGHDGNWVQLDPTSDFNLIIVRRFLLDWEEDPGHLEVEMIGELQGYDEQDENAVARRIDMAADFNLAVIERWAISFYDFAMQMANNTLNAWASVPGELMANMAGSASCNYAFLPYDIKSDEAIVIEMEPPQDSTYWSYLIVDVWDKSLDFMHNQTDFNMGSAAIDSDGKVRAVLSFNDPGVANWLDPMHRARGIVALRNYRSKSFTTPTAKVVKAAEIRSHLPSGTNYVTDEERRCTVGRRRQAILQLYRD